MDLEPREREVDEEGEPVYVDRSDAERGSEGPFFVVYADPGGRRRYGFLCGNCGSLSNAMDPMGRIACNDCPNVRKPTEWDAAHE